MKYYTIYKITNIVNNKIYIGKHITNNLKDGYMGSGEFLLSAINKYGIDKFKKEFLYKFKTEKEMNNMEKKIVNKEFLSRKDVYNLRIGGDGGWDYINNKLKNHNTKIARTVFKNKLKKDKKFKKKISSILSLANKKRFKDPKERKKLSLANKKRFSNKDERKKMSLACLGKIVSLKTRKKMSKSQKGRKHSIATKKKISLSMKKYYGV